MGRTQLIGLALAGTSISACTTSMETRPVPPGAASVYGTEYSLPALELEFAVTRRLVDCSPPARVAGAPAVQEGGQGQAGASSNSNGGTAPDSGAASTNQPVVPKFEFKVEPKQEFVASEVFSMDYSALSKAWKTAGFKVEWHANGMLKTINVEATDKSAEIALEALKAGISIAKLAGGIPSGGAALGTATPTCPVQVETRKGYLKDKKTGSDTLAAQTAIVESFSGRDTAALDETSKTTLNNALNETKKQIKAIAELDKKLAELDKVLAFTETVRWQPAAKAGTTDRQDKRFPFELTENSPVTIEDAARAKWIKGLFGVDNLDPLGSADDGCEDVDDDKDGEPDAFLCRLERSLAFAVSLEPEPVNGAAKQLADARAALGVTEPKTRNKPKRDHVRGVVTRMAVRSRFYGCSGVAQPCHRASPDKLFDQLVTVPQLGHYLVLPFSNGFGEDNQLTANFNEAGTPTMVEYKEKQAAALVAAKAANQGAEALLGLAADVRAFREAEKAEEEGAALKALQSQSALLAEQKKIVELQAAITPANADLAQQKARLEKELGIIQTERDIAKVQREIAELDAKLAVQPGDLALAAEKDRLATLEAVLRSQAGIRKLCNENSGLAGCPSS